MDYTETIFDVSHLVLVDDASGQVLFDETAGPNSKFSTYAFTHKELLADKQLTVYGAQIGTVVANLAEVIPIKQVIANKLSKHGKTILDKFHVSYQYNELIDLVESSKMPGRSCPIERSLVNLDNDEAIENLSQRFGKD